MIQDIISFSISNNCYAVELQKAPIILSATDYLPTNFLLENSNYYFKFSNLKVELINLAKVLRDRNANITKSSKILVGEKGDELFGILVDSVIEIVNLNGDLENNFYEELNDHPNVFAGSIELSGEKLKMIDINELLKIIEIRNQ
ncbi:MAG: hypothetical protein GY936_11505 [Ignavibacteriae bacterium]|nr:hypothetical protein [Ignavibacteriota bacterium]